MSSYLYLAHDGLGALLDVTDNRLPAILHWGADLGTPSLEEVQQVALAGVHPIVSNIVDEPVRVAILPEHWTGWVGRPGLSGDRSGADWSPRFTVDSVILDGVQLTGELALHAGRNSEIHATDREAGLGLTLTIEVTDGGVLRSRATLSNEASSNYRVDDLVLAYPVPNVARELLDMAGRWGRERAPQRRDFTVGTHLREGRKGRTGPDAAHVLHAGTPGFGFRSGEVWGVHVGWSGNHTHYAERLSTGEKVLGGGELLLPGEAVLAPGGSYTTPWLYGSYGRGLDEVAQRFHRHLRSRPGHPSAERPVTINVWEAVYFNHDLPPLIELAETAASIGVERYVLDDGWFGSRRDDFSGLGDWWVSDEAWPEGLHPLVEKVHELGMQFGLWFEPEMINLDSDTARAHPEWIMGTGSRTPVPSRHQQVINLGIPECYAYVRDAMSKIIDEYQIDYIKWDHNRDLIDAGSHPSGAAGVHVQTSATYRLMAELKAAHPGLEIESCSSGGARVDLGVLQHTDRVWVSDCIDPHERQMMMRWTTQLIPPELMGSHIASGVSHTTGRSHDLNFRAATALFGHLGIEWDIRQATEAELAELAEWIAFYKEHRGLLLGGDLVRLDLADETLVGHGVVSPDRERGLFCFASIERSHVALPGRVCFAGLDSERRYRVTPQTTGTTPSGLYPPEWWGLEPEVADGPERLELMASGHYVPRLVPSQGATVGVEMSGRLLQEVGLMHAPVNPDHAVLYLVEAVD